MIRTFLRGVLLVACSGTFCNASFAQMVTVRVQSSVCTNGICTSMSGYGTGVVVATEGNTSLVLTAAHNFDLTDRNGYPTQNGQINAIRIGGRARGELLRRWRDSVMDLAVVRAYAALPAVPLSTQPPHAGDTVTVNGYDFADTSQPQLQATTCRVLNAEQGERAHTNRSWPVGTSGGGVFDTAGNLVGIAVTSNGFIANRNFREVIESLTRYGTFETPRQKLSADAGQPAATESVPSTQGETPDGSKQSAAGDMQRYVRSKENGQKFEQTAATVKDSLPVESSIADPAGPETVPRPSAASETGSMPSGQPATQEAPQPKQQTDVAAQTSSTSNNINKAITLVDAIVSNPWTATAITGATGGAGAAGLAGWQMLMAYRRRKKSESQADGQVADAPSQDPTKAPPMAHAVEVKSDPRIDGIIDYLKDREGDKQTVDEAVKSLKGLVARLEIQPDGSTEETFWKDGVRLAASRSPEINVLGGPAVARAISDYVARRHAKAANDTI